VLEIGPDGRERYTKDPDATYGRRSATNSRPAGHLHGYDAHAVVQVRDAKSPDGVEHITFGPDVPSVITDLVLVPAGSPPDEAIVPALLAAKDAGQDIREVIWDRGYSQLTPAATTHPLRQAGIDTVFWPKGSHQRLAKPLADDCIVIDGIPYSAHMPEELRRELPFPPYNSTEEERLRYDEAFNRRAAWRYQRIAAPDAGGSTRWQSPFRAGFLRSLDLPWTMKERSSPSGSGSFRVPPPGGTPSLGGTPSRE
jgi:hypothetical protein